MNRILVIFVFLLAVPLITSVAIADEVCPDLDRELERQVLRRSGYEIPTIGSLPLDLQNKINTKPGNKCLYLLDIDSSVGAYGLLLRVKGTDTYHLVHAVKCDCHGAKPFRLASMGEFKGDIPLIRRVKENYIYQDQQTGKSIDLGSAWKSIYAEMVGSGEQYVFRRKGEKAIRYRVY